MKNGNSLGWSLRVPFVLLALNIGIIGVNAQKVSGTGIAENREKAKEIALNDLASQIAIDIRSETQMTQSEKMTSGNGSTGKGNYEETFVSNIVTKSEFPLYGVSYNYSENRGDVTCVATIDKEKSKEIYQNRINSLKTEIDNLSSEEIPALSLDKLYQLSTLVKDYEILETVGFFFSIFAKPLEVTRFQIREEIANRPNNVSSMDELVELVANKMKSIPGKVYVYPPKFEGNNEITNFAKTIRDRLSTSLGGSVKPNLVDYYLKGNYRETKDRLELTISLVNPNYESISGITLMLNEAVFSSYEWKPSSLGLDQLIADGVVLSSDLRVQLNTNMGSNDLIFEEGDELDLLVKSNQSTYIYMVVHNQSSDGVFSYLLPFGDGDSKREMILYINADDVNRWISLGKYKVAPPFGVERIQAFASQKDPIDVLPEFYWNEDGYPEVGTNPIEVVAKTRGLIRKKKEKTESSETSLTITTMQ